MNVKNILHSLFILLIIFSCTLDVLAQNNTTDDDDECSPIFGTESMHAEPLIGNQLRITFTTTGPTNQLGLARIYNGVSNLLYETLVLNGHSVSFIYSYSAEEASYTYPNGDYRLDFSCQITDTSGCESFDGCVVVIDGGIQTGGGNQ